MVGFSVDYGDFSGGMFVGANAAKQPNNTFIGDNMMACESDGTLMPASAWVPRSDAAVVSSPPKAAQGTLQAYQSDANVGNTLYAIEQGGGNLIREGIDNDATHHAWDQVGRSANATTNSVGQFARMGPYVVWGAPNSTIMYLHNQTALTLTTAATPVGVFIPVTFGSYIVGALGANLWWSAPSDPTSWPSVNFVQIGGSGYGIQALVVVGSTLLVGKTDGWWQVNGVLGANETIVQVSTEGFGAPGSTQKAAVPSDGSILFPGRLFDGSAVRTLRGSIVSVAATQTRPAVATVNNCYQAGGFTLSTGTSGAAGDELLMRSPTGKWARLNAAHQGGLFINAFAEAPATHPFGYAWLGATVPGGFPYRMLLAPVNPTMNGAGTAFNSATAQLAEYRRTSRVRIKSVVCELDLGTTTLNAPRSISVSMRTPGQPLHDGLSATAYSNAMSTPQTITLPSLASSAGERVTVELNTDDGQDTYSMIPEVTLQGVKLRRLIARCAEVS